MTAVAPALAVRPVVTLDDVETMRLLRNQGRQYMTRDRRAISPEDQAAWWGARSRFLYAYLYRPAKAHEDVAFGMLRKQSGRWWVTLAVAEGWRGHGIGTAVYRHLATVVWPCYAEILADNIASIRAAEKAGFVRRLVGVDTVLYVRDRA
jgi:GNAT superfamily N-acetyltransferase